ncbi:MAG: pantetheine-phosphate adenylyltransferase [Elusimicrobia bacterium]|nr:pantetheine-phosphate adenylyltransferase [Elusimicrobiota bacterium]MDE2314288.1 pantetheine-phosphate adenylyltransferase [Elusimicrobiota bacterium]
MTLAVYPGSFDPITLGHMDLVRRARRIFGSVVVAVLDNASKRHTFGLEERVEMARASTRGMKGVSVDTFSGLLADYMKVKRSRVLIRGVRVVSDMDYEFQLAFFNRRLGPDVETVFLMPDEKYTYLASSMVKEVARLGAPVDSFVTPLVARRLRQKFQGGA